MPTIGSTNSPRYYGWRHLGQCDRRGGRGGRARRVADLVRARARARARARVRDRVRDRVRVRVRVRVEVREG
jgi:hypothetical protein